MWAAFKSMEPKTKGQPILINFKAGMYIEIASEKPPGTCRIGSFCGATVRDVECNIDDIALALDAMNLAPR